MPNKLVNAGGLLAMEKDGEIICVFEPGGDGWACVFTTGNKVGNADTYTSFQAAFNRARRFVPGSNEGER